MPATELIPSSNLTYLHKGGAPEARKQTLLKSLLRPARMDSEIGRGLVTGLTGKAVYNAGSVATQTLRPAPVSLQKVQEKLLEEVLFDALSNAKISTSRVAMYLREGWRDKLFLQLDNLMDPEEWDPEDKPLQAQSFSTFLKAICDVNPSKRPGLGLTYAGNLIASWRGNSNAADRISLEFMQGDKVKLIGSRIIDNESVSFSALAPVGALKQTLVNMSCAAWLGCD